MKKLLAILLVLALGSASLVGCNKSTSSADDEDPTKNNTENVTPEEKTEDEHTVEELAYTLSEDGSYYIVSGIGSFSGTEVVIPSTYKDLPVTTIGSHAFTLKETITGITLGENISTIEDEAFTLCTSLKSFYIPAGVTSIGKYVFTDCSSLTEITVNENNPIYKSVDGNLYTKDGKTLLQYAAGNTRTSFTVPEEVVTIDEAAFCRTTKLTDLIIPGNVKKIGANAVSNCTNLINVTISEGLTDIGTAAFVACTNLKSISIPDSVTNIGSHVFLNCSGLESVTLGSGITQITEEMFWGCKRIIHFVISDKIESIGKSAFAYSSICNIVIYDSVTTVAENAFISCNLLSCVYYFGTEEEWNQINVGMGNEHLEGATRYYYSETEPASVGNYWHFVDGEAVAW